MIGLREQQKAATDQSDGKTVCSLEVHPAAPRNTEATTLAGAVRPNRINLHRQGHQGVNRFNINNSSGRTLHPW
jgi:hypothetical protein